MKLYKEEDIKEIKEDLLKGKIIAFGTDTVFGLACIYDNPKAIKKIFNAKKRDTKKSLPMMCSNFRMLNKVAYTNKDIKKIMKAYMPGPLTIIFKKKDVIDDYVTSGKETIGIRIPNDKWILKLIKEVDKPLLVTSANLSNEEPLFKWQDVKTKLGKNIDGLVCKDARGDKASTIIDCSNEKIKLLRKGPISFKDILKVVKE